MELQATLVTSRIDDLRQTATELHAGAMAQSARSARTAAAPADSLLSGLRRGVGVRLIALGLALALPSMRGKSGSAARLV